MEEFESQKEALESENAAANENQENRITLLGCFLLYMHVTGMSVIILSFNFDCYVEQLD